jgi:hypothetical protein
MFIYSHVRPLHILAVLIWGEGGNDEIGNKLAIQLQATSEPHMCIITGPETE